MTSLSLLLWIVAGIVLQLAVYHASRFRRNRQDYRALRRFAAELKQPVAGAGASAPAAWAGLRNFRVERKIIEDAAQTICSFHLVAEDGLALPPFLPGQYLTFQLDVDKPTGGAEKLVRCYSLSDAPRADAYRVSIKRAPAPPGSSLPPGRSSNFFHDRVAVGSLLQVRAPSGYFHIERSAEPVVLIGGGIGVTPMLSMLNWALAEQPGREVWLFYGVRQGRELVMKSHLEALAAAHPNFHLRLCFSDPLPDEVVGRDFQHAGRIDVELLREQLPARTYDFYLCGPPPMMQSLVPALEDWGVPDARIHFEAFGPASIQRRSAVDAAAQEAASAGAIVVDFARSGRQLNWQAGSASLLEFAEANGIAVDSGCRSGSCGSCQTTIKSGAVAYRQPPDFDPEIGTCLLCVCTPKTSLTLEL